MHLQHGNTVDVEKRKTVGIHLCGAASDYWTARINHRNDREKNMLPYSLGASDQSLQLRDLVEIFTPYDAVHFNSLRDVMGRTDTHQQQPAK